MKLIRRSVLALLAVVLLGGLLLVTASVQTYRNLTAETLVAEISFESLGPEHYLARLRTGNGCEERKLEVFGDQWRIDAAFLKWKYWASALGLDAQYRLERFEGRYRSTDEQNERPTLAHDIAEPTAIDIARLAHSLGPLNFLVDATYGSSTYEDIDTERIFDVYRGTTGIFTRATARRSAISTPGEGLEIEVRRACAAPPGIWGNAASWTDRAVRRLGLEIGGRES